MTDLERQLIAAYIPSPPDPELGFMDFFMLDSADRVIKVHIVSISLTGNGNIYEVLQSRGVSGYAGVYNAMGESGEFPGWYYMWALYDNKQDCRDGTHTLCDGWERLRELQVKEREEGES